MVDDVRDDNEGSAPPRRRTIDREPAAVVTKADLWDVRDMLASTMADGFRGVHRRQDTTNGRVNSAHERLAEHDAKLQSLRHEVFGVRGRAKSVEAASPDGDGRTFTMRDVRMIGFGGGAVIAFLMFLWKVMPAIERALQP